MVLLAVADHKYRIEVGYGLEGILPDGKTGDIGRDMVPDLKASDYDGAMTLAVGEIAQVIADDAKITLNDNQPAPEPQPAQHRRPSVGEVILHSHLLIFFGGFSLFACSLARAFLWRLGRGAGVEDPCRRRRLWRRRIRWRRWRWWRIRRWRRWFWRRRRRRKLVTAAVASASACQSGRSS